MFEKTFFVLSPSYHGATLLAKLINAHPELSALGDTYPANAFDQLCGCGELVSQCGFWRAIKADVGSERYPHTRLMLPQYPSDRGGRLGRFAFSDFLSFWASPSVLRRVQRTALPAFREDYEAFLAAVYRHTREPGRLFVDGLKFNSRVSALVAAGFRIGGVIHLYRDPVDFVASSMRNTRRSGWRGVIEHSLRFRLYHARARQVERSLAHIRVHYEALADDIDGQLERLFEFLGVNVMTLAQLQTRFDREWHFMGNRSLFRFDGVIERSHHDVARTQRQAIQMLTGSRSE